MRPLVYLFVLLTFSAKAFDLPQAKVLGQKDAIVAQIKETNKAHTEQTLKTGTSFEDQDVFIGKPTDVPKNPAPTPSIPPAKAAPTATPVPEAIPTAGSGIPNEPLPTPTPTPLPDLNSTGIEKIFIVIADSKIEPKLILSTIKAIKALKFAPKLIVGEAKSTLEIPSHIDPAGKLLFEDFAKASRLRFPFKDNERRIFLVPNDIFIATIGKPALIGIDVHQGSVAISTTELLKNTATISVALQKLILRGTAGLFGQLSTCGVLGPLSDLESLKQLPSEFCAQDIEALKTVKLLK